MVVELKSMGKKRLKLEKDLRVIVFKFCFVMRKKVKVSEVGVSGREGRREKIGEDRRGQEIKKDLERYLSIFNRNMEGVIFICNFVLQIMDEFILGFFNQYYLIKEGVWDVSVY